MKKLIFILLLFGCSEDYVLRKGVEQIVVSAETNVHFTFYRNGHETIENRNDYPIRIRKIYYFNGELTYYIRSIEPHEKISSWTIENREVGFYISDINGTEIGFVTH